jgi:hypothetical protein
MADDEMASVFEIDVTFHTGPEREVWRLANVASFRRPYLARIRIPLRGREGLERAQVRQRLVVGPQRLTAYVGGAGAKMRLDAITNLIFRAPCDNRID